jgi:hypothetical protein
VKPDCQEHCKDWLRPAGAGSSAGEGGGCVAACNRSHRQVTNVNDDTQGQTDMSKV